MTKFFIGLYNYFERHKILSQRIEATIARHTYYPDVGEVSVKDIMLYCDNLSERLKTLGEIYETATKQDKYDKSGRRLVCRVDVKKLHDEMIDTYKQYRSHYNGLQNFYWSNELAIDSDDYLNSDFFENWEWNQLGKKDAKKHKAKSIKKDIIGKALNAALQYALEHKYLVLGAPKRGKAKKK